MSPRHPPLNRLMPTALEVFTMPTLVKITGRTSTITNAFVNAIIPVVWPTEAEVSEAIEVLGMSPGTISCAYCGDTKTEWDHLRPLVREKRPTGYVSEIANLVPACGKCNQSKGSNKWRSWIQGNARLSPHMRQIPDLEERIGRLSSFERWREPRRIDFGAAAGADLWRRYWERHEQLVGLMRECQETAEAVRRRVNL